MLRSLLCVLLLATCASPAWAQKRRAPAPSLVVPPLSAKLGERVQLFNGQDLKHWIWFQKPSASGDKEPGVSLAAVWTIEDGVLKSKGKPTGYLRTTGSFTNYVLTVEERHVTPGDAGLLVGITPPDRFWTGIELQTATGEAGDIWNHNRVKLNADLLRIKPDGRRIVRVGPDSQSPVGQWDTLEVTADGGNLSFKVNGRLQNVATEVDGLKGPVGILVEGAEMEFRKVELQLIGDPFEGTGAGVVPSGSESSGRGHSGTGHGGSPF